MADLYFNGDELVNGLDSLESIEYDPINYMKDKLQCLLNDSPSFTYESTIKFISVLDLYKLTGLYDWVINNCPNKKVRHLIINGKTSRVRNKNFNRAIKIIEKELI